MKNLCFRLFQFLIVFVFLLSCNNEKEQKNEAKVVAKDSIVPSKKANPEAVRALLEKLPEAHLPLKVSISDLKDSMLIELSEQELKGVFPESEADSSDTKVCALAKISLPGGVGIFYYSNYPTNETDETEPQEITRIMLALYNNSFEESDYQQLAIQDYSSGWTLFRSFDDIEYFHEAEMEFINLEIKKFKISGNKFVEVSSEIKEFSGEKYYDRYKAFIDEREKGFHTLP